MQCSNMQVFFASSNGASLLRTGHGVSLDKKKAAKLYKIDADQNDVESMYNYVIMLKNGEGIQKNEKEAIPY